VRLKEDFYRTAAIDLYPALLEHPHLWSEQRLSHRHFALVEQLRPATLAAACSCGSQAGLSSFPNQFPLELGQGPEDAEDELATRGRRVDLLGQASEGDPFLN
jgi:hypothetical protein